MNCPQLRCRNVIVLGQMVLCIAITSTKHRDANWEILGSALGSAPEGALENGGCSGRCSWDSNACLRCTRTQRAENGGLDPSWFNLEFLGHPDCQSRGPKILVLKGFGTSGLKIGGTLKTPNSTTTDPTPPFSAFEFLCRKYWAKHTWEGGCKTYQTKGGSKAHFSGEVSLVMSTSSLFFQPVVGSSYWSRDGNGNGLFSEICSKNIIGWSRLSGRRTSGSSWPSLWVQVLAVSFFIS